MRARTPFTAALVTAALGCAMAALGAGQAGAAPPQDPLGTWTFQVENDAVSTLKGTSDRAIAFQSRAKILVR